MSDVRTSDQRPSKIGLALSGGGSRAIAFHLGCMRALHDRGILDRVSVVSTVSGGSVIGAIWAYTDCPFDEFDNKIQALLRKGLKGLIVRKTLASVETLRILASLAVSGSLALLSSIARLLVSAVGFIGVGPHRLRGIVKALQAPLPRFASRTTAFIRALDEEVFRGAFLKEVKRSNLQVIINATELRTQTAFRYGSAEIGSWRFGKLSTDASVATAVGASAAFPALLPALDHKLRFIKDGTTTEQRVIVSDGGIYDNLGISCLIPGRDSRYSTNPTDVDFIVACVAGQGLPDASIIPYFWVSRMVETVNTIHRRTHSMAFNQLHRLDKTGDIQGFVLPYLGQNDEALPCPPADLVSRDRTFDYPTDFDPMTQENIDLIAKRGEQLTRNLIETYHPGL